MEDESRLLTDEVIKYAMNSANGNLLCANGNDLEWVGEEEMRIMDAVPEYRVLFSDDKSKVVGELNWSTSELKFTGKIKNSARVFFDCLKPYVDNYIRQELRNG